MRGWAGVWYVRTDRQEKRAQEVFLSTYWHAVYNSAVSVRERTILNDRRLSAKLVPTFADRGCHVVSVTDPYGRILGFLDRDMLYMQ
jgi:CBS-domain-containing membrane protein